MPEFGKHADYFRDMARKRRDNRDYSPFDAADYLRAERHARLLQQIWEWVKSPTSPDFPEAYRRGDIEAKAHVRALLGEPEEPTR